MSTDHFDEESEFYERIYAHVKCTLHLNLEVWQVKAIKSSDFCVDEEGKVTLNISCDNIYYFYYLNSWLLPP